MKKIFFFLYHFLVANVFFLLLDLNTPSINNAFESFKRDLEKISFPYEITPTLILFTLPIAFFITLFSSLYKKYFSTKDKLRTLQNFLTTYILSALLYLFVIFFFKILELNRIYVFIFLIVLLFSSALHEAFHYFLDRRKKNIVILSSVLLLILNFFLLTQSSQESSNDIYLDENVSAEENLLLDSISDIEPNNNLECNEWKGSNNYAGCLYGLSLEVYNYNFQVSNLIVFNEELYILLKNGLIYKQSNQSESPELFIDLSSKVNTSFPGIEQGLYSIAFHPSENYFVVSYSNNDIALVIEKYEYSSKGINSESSEQIIKIANNQRFHFGGSLIWSDYFNDFLLGVGDMKSNVIPVLQSDPLDTTSLRGKVVLLNSFTSDEVPLIAEHNINPPLRNIVAYGLRNPWQFLEYDNKLFITVVGSQFIEELNVFDLNVFISPESVVPRSFGWPLFSGIEYSTFYKPRGLDELIYDDGSVTDLYFFDDNNQLKADKYLADKSTLPSVFYEHAVNPNVIRAAIIGGDIIVNEKSKYFEHYFFTDYVERELFAYDINKDILYIFPLPDTIQSNPTSVRVSPFADDTILISSRDGSLLTVRLP